MRPSALGRRSCVAGGSGTCGAAAARPPSRGSGALAGRGLQGRPPVGAGAGPLARDARLGRGPTAS
eukprot:9748430-Lingulodinium_polyedra.AAC.1